ncbi:MAG: hypothetical protein LUG64_04920, partial [Clostridiales bacterium]|nr:hypothetical protein [Clostridiales bacterium]
DEGDFVVVHVDSSFGMEIVRFSYSIEAALAVISAGNPSTMLRMVPLPFQGRQEGWSVTEAQFSVKNLGYAGQNVEPSVSTIPPRFS